MQGTKTGNFFSVLIMYKNYISQVLCHEFGLSKGIRVESTKKCITIIYVINYWNEKTIFFTLFQKMQKSESTTI